jgi:glycosyltransferase involved in cell wall biosynthesis
MRILHAIHDFLPRHQAGSEIYALELSRALAERRHHVTVLSAEFDPSRRHGELTWRVQEHIPVIELVNNWVCDSFVDTYRSPRITEQIGHVLDAVQPEAVHVHSLLNLSFDLPALARQRGIPVVATLHDYTLVCSSGGQRLHRADNHLCQVIDSERCARCFRESPFHAQISYSTAATLIRAPGLTARIATMARHHLPKLTVQIAHAARHVNPIAVTERDIAERLAQVRDVFENVDLFVAPSRSLASEFERLGIEPSKLRVSDYGFSKVVGRRHKDIRCPVRLGYVGTLDWHKGVHVLLDAVRKLPLDRYELLIFGDMDVFPAYAATLRRQAAGLPVRFMGRFDRSAINDVYAAFDVLVVPSLWLENSPLVIHESFMAGVPVVGSRIGGIEGLVTHGQNGWLYDGGSPVELAAALHALIDDPVKIQDAASQVPTVKPIGLDAQEWEEIYEEVRARGYRPAVRSLEGQR